MLLPLQILVNLRGVTGAAAALAWTESNDVSAVTVNLSQSLALAWTEANDGAAANITLSQTATLAWTEADDAAAIAVALSDGITLAWTEANDTTAITGSLAQAVSLAWTESDDTTAIVLAVAGPDNVTVAWSEVDDVAAILVSVPVALSAAWTEADDLVAIVGISESALPTAGASGGFVRRPRPAAYTLDLPKKTVKVYQTDAELLALMARLARAEQALQRAYNVVGALEAGSVRVTRAKATVKAIQTRIAYKRDQTAEETETLLSLLMNPRKTVIENDEEEALLMRLMLGQHNLPKRDEDTQLIEMMLHG